MKQRHRHTQIALMVLIILLSAISICGVWRLGIVDSDAVVSIESILDVCGMILSGILYINCCYDPEAEHTDALLFRQMLLTTFFSFGLGLLNTILFLFLPLLMHFNIVLTYCSYLCTFVFFLQLWRYFVHLTGQPFAVLKWPHIFFRVISVIQLLLFLLNPLTHVLFYFDSAGQFHYYPTIWLFYIYYYLAASLCLYLVLRSQLDIKTKHRISYVLLIPIIVSTFGLFAIQLDCLIFFSSLMQLILIYCGVYIQRGSELQKQRNELAESQLHSMLLQINPHFIYNTLGSISSLCYSDPMAAASHRTQRVRAGYRYAL